MQIVNKDDGACRTSNIFDGKPGMGAHAFCGRAGCGEEEKIITINQQHGTTAVWVSTDEGRAYYKNIEGDILLTMDKGLPIGVRTADCLPVLLFNPVSRAIGAVHAGWRGTAAGVAGRALVEMDNLFVAAPENTFAALGPRIGPCCYTVGEEVKEKFADSPHVGEIFSGSGETLTLDLTLANLLQLKEAGVPEKNISIDDTCTCCTCDEYFSYRKDKNETGRQVSYIMLKE